MDIEVILEEKGISYSYSGNDLLVKCLNPDHEDNNPSMRIDKDTGIYHCFSCGYKGNLLKENDLYIDLIKVKANKLKEKIYKIKFPYVKLFSNKVPYEEDFRNISSKTILKFNGFTTNDEKDYLIFPLTDNTGNIRLYQGRHLYSNSGSKYKFFPRNIKPLPFPPPRYTTKINKSIILVEGILDMLRLQDRGLTNAICIFGCTFKEIDEIIKYDAEKIYLMFDNDEAGKKGMKYLSKKLLNTEIIEIRSDPNDMTNNEIYKLKEYINDCNN